MTGPQHFLLVEDDANLCAMVEEYLKKAGHAGAQFTSVTTLKAGVEVLQGASPPDFLIVDLKLADAVGLHAPRMLIQAMPAGQAILPLIIFTGTIEETEALNGIAMGARDFIFKGEPNLATTLRRAVAKAWRHYRREQQLVEDLRRLYGSPPS